MLRRLSLLVALALLIAGCVQGSGSSTTTLTVAPSTSNGQGTSTTLGSVDETTTTLASTWTQLSGVDDLPQAVQEELLDLVRETEKIRGLQFVDPPLITVVTDAELEQRVRSKIEEDSSDFPADEALYKLLGLLPPGADLETLLLDVYGEQVAGFYDGDTGELVVPKRQEGFTVAQRSTLVHELTHALTDQHFHFNPVLQNMFDEDRLDQVSAFQALVEGDATETQFLFLRSLSERELGEYLAEALQTDTSALDAAPQFVQDSLTFPYDSGLAFVQRLYRTGGWAAVNDAYSTFPNLPGSTEQIMTPGDYRRDLPMRVTLKSISIPGYALERRSVWGELGFRIMIDQVLGEEVGVDAADGWGGDVYDQWFDGQNAAIVIAYVGDTAKDLTELKDALVDYALKAVPEEAYVWVEEINGTLYFIAADEPAVGLSVLAAVKG